MSISIIYSWKKPFQFDSNCQYSYSGLIWQSWTCIWLSLCWQSYTFFSERTHVKAFFWVKSNTKWKLLQIIFHGYKYYPLVTGHTSNFVVVCILWFCFLAPNYRTGRYLDRSVDCRSTMRLNYLVNLYFYLSGFFNSLYRCINN